MGKFTCCKVLGLIFITLETGIMSDKPLEVFLSFFFENQGFCGNYQALSNHSLSLSQSLSPSEVEFHHVFNFPPPASLSHVSFVAHRTQRSIEHSISIPLPPDKDKREPDGKFSSASKFGIFSPVETRLPEIGGGMGKSNVEIQDASRGQRYPPI